MIFNIILLVCFIASSFGFTHVSKVQFGKRLQHLHLSDEPSESAAANEKPSTRGKGFGKAKPSTTPEDKKDAGTMTYEAQAKRGVPEYNIFLRPSNGTDGEWIPAGSMTIPRDTNPSKAILEVEKELLKGTFKLYPKLKAFYDVRADMDKASTFEYGYVLKAFPDEEITPVKREDETAGGSNFVMNWIGKLTNPIDNSNLNNKGEITIKQ
mmetsp:Transcript_26458/g.26708  ORF Transcript_26458/g.26708 Transcript_26458/m.26708 type:complete len:210 (+) Transcript_26458:95-724(+)